MEESEKGKGQNPEPFEIDPHHSRRDAGMLRRAARENWAVKPEILEKAPAAMAEMLDSPSRGRRVAAAKALVAMVASNQRDMHHVERMDQEMGIVKIRQERAEAGLPNDSIAVQVIPPPQVMPAPDWMERMGLADPNHD